MLKKFVLNLHEMDIIENMRVSADTQGSSLVSSTNKTDCHNIAESGIKHHNPTLLFLNLNLLFKYKWYLHFSWVC